MTTLYYSQNSCSMSVHIALEIIGEEYEAFNVADIAEEYTLINPKGWVPVLIENEWELMTQNEALLKYLWQKYPEAQIAGNGSLEETYQINKWLAFVSGDLHPSHSLTFHPAACTLSREQSVLDSIKAAGLELIKKQLMNLEAWLEGKKFLVGEEITIADMYAFPVSRWYGVLMWQSMKDFPNILAYHKRMSQNPAVERVLKVHNPL